jgi:hypothetical protein
MLSLSYNQHPFFHSSAHHSHAKSLLGNIQPFFYIFQNHKYFYIDKFIYKTQTPLKMSQIKIENDDNGSVAACDQQNPLDWSMDTESTNNYGNDLKELKLKIATAKQGLS